MDYHVDFDVNESLKQYLSDPASIQTTEADATLLDCESDPASLTIALINGVLDPIIDAVAESPDAVLRASHFDSLQFLLKCAPTVPTAQQTYIHNSDRDSIAQSRHSPSLPPAALSKILDIVVSGLAAEADVVHNETEADETDAAQHHKRLLEAYAFLLQWSIAAIEAKAAEKSASTSASAIRGKGGKGGKSKKDSAAWDAAPQLQTALEVMSKVEKLRLTKIFPTTSERDTFISLFTRAVYLILESETRAKSTAIRMHCFKVLCVAVKHHGHAYGM